ncbi:MAG: hypothetical protein ACTSR2_11940 [Candidatus Hodarchaeales archaeon]
MKLKVLLLGLLCIFFLGCATAPPPRQIQNIFTVEADFDKVWTALIDTFADLQVPIENMEKDSGLIITDWIDITGQTNEDYCDCGGLGIFSEVARLGKFNVFVKKLTENSCELRVNCQFQQTIEFGEERSARRCVSTGNLEAEIYRIIDSKVRM